MKTFAFRALTVLVLSVSPWLAHAQIVNGDFAAGIANWNPIGDVVVTSGTMQLTTAFTSGDDAPFNLSGHDAVDIGALETAAGVAAYALDHLGEAAYEGSLASQSFSVLAGQTLQFNWLFSSHDTTFLDHAFAVVDGQVLTLADSRFVGPGVQGFSYLFTHSGRSTLAFGVVDTGDFDGVSSLGVSNVQLSPVPEAEGWVMLIAGGCLLIATGRRRRF